MLGGFQRRESLFKRARCWIGESRVNITRTGFREPVGRLLRILENEAGSQKYRCAMLAFQGGYSTGSNGLGFKLFCFHKKIRFNLRINGLSGQNQVSL